MSRSTRLLSIYTRLIHYQNINKSQLSTEFGVSERTVKRDIREIRNYLYDSQEFLDKKDITFDYTTQVYRIPKEFEMNIKKQDLEALLLLLNISNIPVWKDTIIFLKSLVLEYFVQDKTHLFNLINHLEVKHYEIDSSNLLVLQKAVNTSQFIRITTRNYDSISMLPTKLTLYKHEVGLFYRNGQSEKFIPLDQIKDIKLINEKVASYTNEIVLQTRENILLELKKLYPINVIKQIGEDYIVELDIPDTEALHLCITHTTNIKLLGPQYLVKKLKKHLLNMLNLYMID
ncbi:HTH domain-containing protein [Staphylococcus sp. 17KM0847]|uniref:HTH domain-containing protein n=1 Tax=Staphylococcus sp. 17KM0847 TaxID=2583989 RepID=UPI0015DBDAB6|nr:HTH domain-containing protein [Staphylococcus sp. 17KM0847]QLK85258.1 HTH domain-containing protein [Staphylococcus sp. 17KM0847]